MKSRIFKLIALTLSVALIHVNTAFAQDYYAQFNENRVHHNLYLKIPFHQDKFARKNENMFRFGYSAEFQHGRTLANPFTENRNQIRAALANIEFSSLREGRFNLAGIPFAGFNQDGLYAGQDGEESGSAANNQQWRIIALGVVLAAAVYGASQSGTKRVQPETCEPFPLSPCT